MPRIVKIAPEIDPKPYREPISGGKENALEHYLHNVAPSQRLVRPEVMAAYRRSNEQYRDLYKRLAQGRAK